MSSLQETETDPKYFTNRNPEFSLPNISYCMRHVRRTEMLINCLGVKELMLQGKCRVRRISCTK